MASGIPAPSTAQGCVFLYAPIVYLALVHLCHIADCNTNTDHFISNLNWSIKVIPSVYIWVSVIIWRTVKILRILEYLITVI